MNYHSHWLNITAFLLQRP